MVKAGFARVQLLDFEFVTGRDISDIQVELGEDERVSNCRVSLQFQDLTVPQTLIELSLARGGIAVPPGLLAAVQATASSGGATTTAGGGGTTPVVTGSGVDGASANGVPLSNAPEGTQGDDLAKYIVQYCVAVGVADKSHQAYILATAQHESVMGVYTSEIGGESARYAPWYGRGLVQITWEDNYKKFENWIGDDFTSGEEARNRVSSLKYAIPILVCGMTGSQNAPNFTGKVLSDYGEGDSFDFNGARATVNGTDKASTIAGYAQDWLGKLDSLYSPAALGGLDGYAYNYGPLDDILNAGRQVGETIGERLADGVDVIRGVIGDRVSAISRLINQRRPQPQVLPQRNPSPNPVTLPDQAIPGIGQNPIIPPSIPDQVIPGVGGNPVVNPPSPSPAPAPTPEPAPAPSPAPDDNDLERPPDGGEGSDTTEGGTTGGAPAASVSPSYKGTTMTVTLGIWGQFRDARLYQFIYTAISANLVPPYTVTLVGRSIRWNISEGRLPGEEGGPTIIPGVSAPVTTPDLIEPDLTGGIVEAVDGQQINPEDVTPGAGGVVDQISGGGTTPAPGTPRTIAGGVGATVGAIQRRGATPGAGAVTRRTPSGSVVSPGAGSVVNQQPFSPYNLGKLTTLENVTLEEIARRVAYQSGVNVRVAPRAKQFRYSYVKFDPQNPLKTLSKLARNAGFAVRDSSNYPRLAYAPGDGATVGSQLAQGAQQITSVIAGAVSGGATVTTTSLGEISEVLPGAGGTVGELTDGEIVVEDEAGEDGSGATPSGRMAPQITFRIGRSQVTRLEISDEASSDRVVTGDLGQAVTIGVPEDSAKLDVETGELIPPNSVPVGLGDAVQGAGGTVGALNPSISPIVQEPPVAFTFTQVDSFGIQRTFEIGGGGLLGDSDFAAQVLGYDPPVPGAGSVVDEILSRVNPQGETVGSRLRQGSEAITRAIRSANQRPSIGSVIAGEVAEIVERVPGVGNPILPGATPGVGGVVTPDPTGEPDDPNPPDSEDTTDPGGETPAPAPTPAPAAGALPAVTDIPNHTSIGRGYPTNTRILASSVTIALKPGDFVELVEGFVPAPFARKWRIDRVRHSLDSSGFWSDIFFYLPVKIQRQSPASSGGGGGTTGAAGAGAPPGGAQGTVGDAAALEGMTSLTFVNPNPTGTTTSPMGPRTAPTAGASSNHRGIDIAAGQGTPLLACAAGTVVDIGGVSGYGPDCVTLYHGSVTGPDGQYFIGSMYGHGSGAKVGVGDFVQQGQEIVLEDTQGVSTGSHLHWNVYASKTWKPEVGAPYPSDVTAFVDGLANFVDQAWTSDGNIKGHRFTS